MFAIWFTFFHLATEHEHKAQTNSIFGRTQFIQHAITFYSPLRFSVVLIQILSIFEQVYD